MNEDKLHQIFDRYIEKFDVLNGDVHKEYFKWQIAKRFRPMMDEALASPADSLPVTLSKLQQLTAFLVDNNRIQPFGGIVQCAKREPETVRAMFEGLFSNEGTSQDRISSFLTDSHALRDRYFPGSFRYTNDVHSVTAYLAMYDPDQHYVYKASHARKFADCVEFYDDWGSGDAVKIDVYYRMCDQLVDAIMGYEKLLAVDAKRFTGELGISQDTLHSDTKKHILAFDLIYCYSTYNLFADIMGPRLSASEKRAAREKQETAAQRYEELSEKLDSLEAQLMAFEETQSYLAEVFSVGSTISHKVFGQGKIISVDSGKDGPLISVDFQGVGRKRIDLCMVVKNNIASADSETYSATIESCRDSLDLFGHTKMEALKNSIKATEQEIMELGKIYKVSNSHNIQQNFTPPPPEFSTIDETHNSGSKKNAQAFLPCVLFRLTAYHIGNLRVNGGFLACHSSMPNRRALN